MTYRGTVKDGVIVLEPGAQLAEGAVVEVRAVDEEQLPRWGEVFKDFIGKFEGLPSDLAENHDHYIHGTPKDRAQMSRACFPDTSGVLAALNPVDAHHREASHWFATARRPLITTTWILLEIADALSDRRSRKGCAEFLRRLQANPQVTVVPATEELFQRALDLYEQRADKDWPLTDCTSCVVMDDHGSRMR